MSLIRCLGPISLPASYRQYMREDARYFKRKIAGHSHIQFQEELFPDRDFEGHEEILLSTHHFPDGDVVEVNKPYVCQKLVNKLSAFFGGRQHHLCMTLVDIDTHTDRRDDEINSTVLLIPFQASHLHYLEVEDQRQQLLPNRIYAFNHYRLHSLVYDSDFGSNPSSKPLSVLKVRFERMLGNSRKTQK